MPWFPLMILLSFPRKVLLPSSITSHHVRSNFDLAIPMHHISGGRSLRFSEQTAGPAIPSASIDASVSLDGILMRFSEDVHGVSLIQFHTMIRFRTPFCRSKIDTSESTTVDVSCIHIGSREKMSKPSCIVRWINPLQARCCDTTVKRRNKGMPMSIQKFSSLTMISQAVRQGNYA